MNPVLVFDIETIPDVAGLRRLHDLDPGLSDAEVAEMAFQQRTRITENLQRFIFCHGADFKSKAQSSKSKVIQFCLVSVGRASSRDTTPPGQ